MIAPGLLGALHSHSDSVPALRIIFGRDPQVTGDHYGARNLRLWQVILIWILAMDLLITALLTV